MNVLILGICERTDICLYVSVAIPVGYESTDPWYERTDICLYVSITVPAACERTDAWHV